MGQPAEIRDEWLTALEWIRLADRLVEAEVFGDCTDTGGRPFTGFLADWRELRSGRLPERSAFRPLFERLRRRWIEEPVTDLQLQVWDLYLASLWKYRDPGAVIKTLDDYSDALHSLSGTFFQTFPFQPTGLESAVSALGALDQFYNNMRDLHEDTLRGLCYLPAELLVEFSIDPSELAAMVDREDRRLVRLHEHLLATLVPDLRRQAAPLLSAPDLHPSWVRMLANFLTRHSRIEYVARLCDYNATAFRARYWTLTQDDLAARTEVVGSAAR
jgi:phytoene synthase